MLGRSFIFAVAAIGAPLSAATPRETLMHAVFTPATKAQALAGIDAAAHAAAAVMAKAPGNRDAAIIHAMAMGYRAKLTRSRSGAVATRTMFEALTKSDPRDAEAQAALGGWHVDVVAGLGGMMGHALLGADKAAGFAALDRAVALGGNRAMFAGLAALLRLQLSGNDVRAGTLAEVAARAATPTPLDAQMQRSAILVLAALRANDPARAQRLARELLPLGRVKG